MRRRGGFALLAVLWVLVGLSALALGTALVAREAVSAAGNRLALERARWRAEGCLERARAAIDAALTGGARDPAGRLVTWTTLGVSDTASPLVTSAGCDISLRAAGTAVDVNAAGITQLRAGFIRGLRLSPARADSLADAILDWRDADQIARPAGAERPWYDARKRPLPRDSLYADRRELALVRGVADVPGIDSMLDVEAGRIVLDLAPAPVLASLPGLTAEALARIAELRVRGERVGDPLRLASVLSPASRDSIAAHYQELVQLTADEPEAWVLTARGTSGAAAVRAEIELRLVRAGQRAAIVRRRTWP